MQNEYVYDLIKTMALAGMGIIGIYYIDKFFKLRSAPILLNNVTPSTAVKEFTVDIPTFWLPYQPGDSKDSIIERYTPNINIVEGNWVLKFNPITANVGGIVTSYTPEPIKIPITNTLSVAQLATRLVPIVNKTTNPAGWNITFAKFTILA